MAGITRTANVGHSSGIVALRRPAIRRGPLAHPAVARPLTRAMIEKTPARFREFDGGAFGLASEA
jgi:hypothetical protein